MECGMIVATRGVADEMENNLTFAGEVNAAFSRYQRETGETSAKRTGSRTIGPLKTASEYWQPITPASARSG